MLGHDTAPAVTRQPRNSGPHHAHREQANADGAPDTGSQLERLIREVMNAIMRQAPD